MSGPSASRVPIGELVEEVQNWNPAKAAPGAVFQYVDISSVDQEQKEIVAARTLECSEAPSRARQLVATGDVLVSTVRPNLNAVARVSEAHDGATASTGFCVLRRRSGVLDDKYLFQWVKTPAFVSEMVKLATGASYPAVSDRIVNESLILLPPLPEQQRIAKVLDAADALRVKRRTALAQLDTLTQAIFVEMFGDPASNPRRWPRLALEKFMQKGPQNGLYKPASDYGTGMPILRIDAFYDGVVTKLGELKRVRVSDKESELYRLRPGDIVVNRVNSMEYLGKCALIPELPEPTIFESNMMRFRVAHNQLCNAYLVEFLKSSFVKSQILNVAKHAVNQSSINQKDVCSFQINHPPLALQQDFATRVAAVERLKAAHRASLAELDALFASLQHRAFRGEL